MDLTGKNFIGNERSGEGKETFRAVNPAVNKTFGPDFHEATEQEIENAVLKAERAFREYGRKSGKEKAAFLEAIADEIMSLGDELIDRCGKETGLPEGRLVGERARTTGQLKLFAEVLKDGSWVDARIDKADPGRNPAPKPDIRSMLRPLGPAGVFGASNFPFAFSVAGGDTTSALAAGCPVVFKAHPAHPGTCEMVGGAIVKAVRKSRMPDGTFSLLHGRSTRVGMALAVHPVIKAIGFTGSFMGGKALYDAAVRRPEPIPVYAEMGSSNPVFILPHALRERGGEIAKGLTASVTLGVGQFCTNPGLVFYRNSDEAKKFQDAAAGEFANVVAGPMLTAGINAAYRGGVENMRKNERIKFLGEGKPGGRALEGIAYILNTNAKDFLKDDRLEDENFGPLTLTVGAEDDSELMQIAETLRGHLTVTLHATEQDLEENADLVAVLERKAGRLIVNGFPTGVEVCHSMVHGGPFPATTDSRTTSVGTRAIERFARPVCYQGFPDAMLPDELKNLNPLGILRLVDGKRTEAAL